ncbi:uncharacterized protein LOC121427776 isoform X2 [Lytechinus variegatus]|nr:uncharacterized protein LOC121427776 isoform X2 [Lytechinus variegatus]XP_041480268.1 uncharacterized protein LOC121427776 isoform X2 [Lytechinus variegatus]
MYLCLGCDSGYANKGKECIPCIFNAFTHQTFFDTSGMLECVDEDKPVITLPNEDKLCLPHDSDEITLNTDLKEEDLKQYLPTCKDDIDGTLKVDISLSLDEPLTVSEIPVTVTCKDNSGNKQISEYTLTVQDCQKPRLSNPTELEFCADYGGNTISFSEDNFPTPLCSDAVDKSPVIEFVDDQSRVFSVGERNITVVCTDAAGLKDELTYTVQVNDCENPTLSEPEELEFCADEGRTKTFDADSFPSPVCNDFIDTDLDVELDDTNSVFSYGDRIITAVCTDDAGLNDTLKYTITIKDCENPTLSEPEELEFCAEDGGNTKSFSEDNFPTPLCTDAVDESPVIEFVGNQSRVFSVGERSITVVCTDAAGLKDKLTYTVQVNDCENPTLSEPEELEFCADEGRTKTFDADSFPSPVCNDFIDTDLDVELDDTNSVFSYGDRIITAVCTDDAGLNDTLKYTITIKDCENPTLSEPEELEFCAEDGGNTKSFSEDNFPTPLCTDAVDESPVIEFVGNQSRVFSVGGA